MAHYSTSVLLPLRRQMGVRAQMIPYMLQIWFKKARIAPLSPRLGSHRLSLVSHLGRGSKH